MKLVFAHDHRFILDSSRRLYLSPGQMPYSLWRRYLEVFSELSVIGRIQDGAHGDLSNLDVSSGPGVKIHGVPNLSSLPGLLSRETPKAIYEQVADADAVIARLPSEVGLATAKVAQELRIPLAVEVVGCVWDGLWNHGSVAGKIYAPLAVWRNRKVIHGADRVLYVSERFLQARYPTKAESIACSDVEIEINRDVLPRRLSRQATRTIGNDQPLRLGLIGTLATAYKGIDVAIGSVRLLRCSGIPVSLHILGPGDASPWRRMASDAGVGEFVEFCGVLKQGSAVHTWLDGIDLYIQPSRQEGLPRALVEAMSRACPCIGSSAGGIPELLEPEYVIRCGRADDLADRIRWLATDSERLRKASDRCFGRASDFDGRTLRSRRKQFLEGLAELAAQRHSARQSAC